MEQSSMRTGRDSCKRSEPADSEAVYWNVTIHPTQYSSERISGRMKLIRQCSSLFLNWIPYQGQSSDTRLTEKHWKLYTIRLVPFSELRSICRHTPTLGWQYIIVVLSSVDKLTLQWGKPGEPPLGHEEGALWSFEKKNTPYGGIEHELRKEIWKFLLGYHSYAERRYLRSSKKLENETTMASQFPGMSDLISPILFVMEDESASFWCFVALMERLGPNFNRDQNGMHTQLFALSKLVELLDRPLHNNLRQNDCLN